jgi:predicted RNA-binding Zn-ribbon protein involved in translation (DUF1610 family)
LPSKEENIACVLDELFVIFNFKFFRGDLKKPVITVQSNRSHGMVMKGWCTTKKMWLQTDTQEEYYEIAVCPEFFDLGVLEIAATFLHELVHLYNLQNEIKDVSRGGYYHNREFKKRAEECGMYCDKVLEYGWTRTSLKPETREYVEDLNIDRKAFNLIRKKAFMLLPPETDDGSRGNGGTAQADPLPRQSYRKYVCPSCGMAVRATRDVNVKCGDCDETMEKEEKARKYALNGNFKTAI